MVELSGRIQGGKAPGPPQFFVSQKRNEISELRSLFRAMPSDSSPSGMTGSSASFSTVMSSREKRREVLKRLIGYMSLGIDVSSLFAEVVMASVTTDLIQKKLISIYLNYYAETNPEIAILVINTYQKDLKNPDPKIRGLALKSLCSLRVESIEEYAKTAIMAGLNDTSMYVRNFAIIGVSKLKQSSHPGIIEMLEKNLDTSPEAEQVPTQLLVSTLLTLNDIRGGLKLNRAQIVMLFNRLSECSIFEKTVVLSSLATYVPRSDDELLGLIETVDPYLSTASPSLLITTIRCLLTLVKNYNHDDGDWINSPIAISVIRRSAPSIITLSYNYSIILFIYQLSCMSPKYCEIFSQDWVWLIPKYVESVGCKILKLKIIGLMSDAIIADSLPTLVRLQSEPPAVVAEFMKSWSRICERNCSHCREHVSTPEITLPETAAVVSLERDLLGASSVEHSPLLSLDGSVPPSAPASAAFASAAPSRKEGGRRDLLSVDGSSESSESAESDGLLTGVKAADEAAETAVASAPEAMTENVAEDSDDFCELVFNQLRDWYALEIPSLCSAVLPTLAKFLVRHPRYQQYVHTLFKNVTGYMAELEGEDAVAALLVVTSLQPLNINARAVCGAVLERAKAEERQLFLPLLQALLRVLLVFPSAVKEVLAETLGYVTGQLSACPPAVVERALAAARLLGRGRGVLRAVYGAPLRAPLRAAHARVPRVLFAELDRCPSRTAVLPFGGAYEDAA